MITRTLTYDEAVRYLLERGCLMKSDAADALDDMRKLDYGALRNEAGAVLNWTVLGGFMAGYTRKRDALEAEAIDKHVCPLCRAGVGEACLKQSSTNNYWDKRRMVHPHDARVEKVRAERRLHPFVETRR